MVPWGTRRGWLPTSAVQPMTIDTRLTGPKFSPTRDPDAVGP